MDFSYTGNMERRKFLRLSHKYALRHSRYAPHDPENSVSVSETLNIGGGGLLFVSSTKYDVCDLLKLEIHIPGWEKFIPNVSQKDVVKEGGPFLAKAIVTRVDSTGPGAYRVAAGFVDLDRQEIWALMFAINKK